MDKGVLQKILLGLSDKNIRFAELRNRVLSLGFHERIKGDHDIFTKAGVAEIMNLQPLKDGRAKAYQEIAALRSQSTMPTAIGTTEDENKGSLEHPL